MVAEGTHGYKIYWVTWFWLLVLTVLEVSLVLVRPPKILLIVGLVTMALMKATLIVAYFMHLRWERLSLVYVVVTPMFLLAIVMLALMGPDALHVLYSR